VTDATIERGGIDRATAAEVAADLASIQEMFGHVRLHIFLRTIPQTEPFKYFPPARASRQLNAGIK